MLVSGNKEIQSRHPQRFQPHQVLLANTGIVAYLFWIFIIDAKRTTQHPSCFVDARFYAFSFLPIFQPSRSLAVLTKTPSLDLSSL